MDSYLVSQGVIPRLDCLMAMVRL